MLLTKKIYKLIELKDYELAMQRELKTFYQANDISVEQKWDSLLTAFKDTRF